MLQSTRRPILNAIALVLALSSSSSFGVEDAFAPEAASGEVIKQQQVKKNYLAVTANPYASQAAKQILAQGGSAIDAAITAQLVLSLVEPQSSGIGGGAFLLHWDAKQQQLISYDGRETAPKAVNEAHFISQDGKAMGFFQAVIGGYSVGTPGVLEALQLAHQEHGKLAWSELFKAPIQLAQQGFLVSPRLHQLLLRLKQYKGLEQADVRRYFFDDKQQAWPVGHRLKNPAYAEALQQLALKPDSFYQGEIAQQIVHKVKHNDSQAGLLSVSDLKDYRAVKRQAVCTSIKQYQVCGMGPPSSGGTSVLAILKLMQLAGINAESSELDFQHNFIQSSKLAFADRNTYSGDSDFISSPVQSLFDEGYLKSRLPLLNSLDARFSAGKPESKYSHFISAESPELVSTTHLSIVDQQGNAVSMTSSIETAFGSRLMVNGFLLNNQLTDFSFQPRNKADKVANRIQAGKRPRSSMSPTMVFKDEKPYLLIGSPGGARIIDYVARVLAQHLLQDISISDSIAQGHIVALNNGSVELEQGKFSAQTQAALTQKGHLLKLKAQTSGLHIIQFSEQGLIGLADSRREGQAAGN